ncbi:MAG: GNAT family N-acetyltransferase [Actinomycetota bacterium]
MKLPAGYASRPPTWDDLDAVVALFKACDLADDGVEDPIREHIEYTWRLEAFALERDAALVFAPEGSLAAYAEAFGLNPELSLEGHVRVGPEHRGKGIGTALASWVERRALDRDPVPAKLQIGTTASDLVAHALLTGRGFENVRTFWHMERSLAPQTAGAIGPSPPPDGIGFRAYRHPGDGVALYEAIEEAFADHWGYETFPFDLHMDEMQRLDPSFVELAVEGDEVVGACLGRPVEGAGWIDVVAVRRGWRGRGIARALLARAFAAFAGVGTASVMLNVDSESATGAPRLYESVGMYVRRSFYIFEKPLRAG